jgi:hypothetical protein
MKIKSLSEIILKAFLGNNGPLNVVVGLQSCERWKNRKYVNCYIRQICWL